MFGSDGCLRDYRQTCGRMMAALGLFGPFTAFVYIFLHLCCRGAFSFAENLPVCLRLNSIILAKKGGFGGDMGFAGNEASCAHLQRRDVPPPWRR